MPQGEGGSLSDGQYLDVTAYLLERNGYAAGNQELTSDAAVLSAVTIRPGAAVGRGVRDAPEFIRGVDGLLPVGRGPTQEELSAGNENSRDWLYHTHDYSGSRYADLDEINTDNVASLAPACIFQIGESGPFQSGPIVYDGVMYVTSLRATIALDAATCRLRWRHEWDERVPSFGLNNRGVAIKDGRVVRATSDGYLFALDAADGKLLWARQIGDAEVGETFTMPPLIYDDLIVIGPAVSEFAIEGWVGAFKLENGEPVWHFNTVPGAKDGTGTWPNPGNIVMGGGGVWTPMSFDPESEELYVAVTNPAPDFPAHLRPGLNLYTNSIVALDIRSGTLNWYDQLVPNDSHDWDVTQVSPLFRTTVDGRERNLVATTSKDAFLRVLDRDTHERLYEVPVGRIENVDVPLTREGVHVCPGIEGGVLWNGPAYNPGTDQLYVGSVEWCATFSLSEEVRFLPGQMYLGGTLRPDATYGGRVTGIDASDGSVRWSYESERPVVGALMTTSGDLVFVGELTGDLVVFHAETGDELYRFHTGGPIGGGVVTYTVDGKQYVAVSSGDPSILNWRLGHTGSPTVLIFALP
jgi:alcohol dehydrogenase (cytochrome c)